VPRRVEPGDAEAVADLLNDYSRLLYGEGELTAAEVEHWWLDPQVEAWVDDGAYADLQPQAEGARFWIDLRGEASPALLEVVESRAREVASPGVLLRAVVAAADQAMLRLFADAGYRRVRSSYTMRVELDGEPEPPVWPERIVARPGRAEDARAVYEAYVDAFGDHWDFHAEPFEEWRRWNLEAPGADPSLWLLANDGDELAGVSLGGPHRSGEPDAGWISILAVRAPWRNRGLGLALLRGSFGELERRGRRIVELGVDAENLTGAVRLYERAGMRVSRRADTLEKPV
jgi:ribosomal protein S18 acetylase RimI-like enzyme